MPLTLESILQFMGEELGIETAALSTDSPLFSSGVIDSFSLVTLLAHIEQTCGFQISPADVNLDNFDSIDRIISYVQRAVGD